MGLHGVSGDLPSSSTPGRAPYFCTMISRTVTSKVFLAVGITQSIESLLVHMPNQLPLYLNTALVPYKEMVVCQGTIGLPVELLATSYSSAKPELLSMGIMVFQSLRICCHRFHGLSPTKSNQTMKPMTTCSE